MTDAPDVYLFVVDSLREDVVDYEPREGCLTPRFASFAERSAVFDTAITHGVGTAPAMTALLTGSLPLSHGGHWWLSDDRWTLAEVLRRAGYRTGAIHTNPNVSRLRNFHQGFDQFDENFLPFIPGRYAERLPDSLLHAANKGVRLFRKTPYLPASTLRRKICHWVDHTDGPRFLWTQFMDVHGPYLEHEGFAFGDKIRAERIWRTAVSSPASVTDELHRELTSRYEAEVAHWDTEFGALVDALEERHLVDDALVIVTSDHGEEFGDHGQYGHGNNAYEENVRVPLVINFPGEAYAGTRVSDPVKLLDVVPTVLSITGTTPPNPAATQFVGDSLVERVVGADGDESGGRDNFAAIIEKQVRGSDAFRFAVRTDRYKYIDDRYESREELYDLSADPGEETDISGDDEKCLAEFRSRVADHVAGLPEIVERGVGQESAEVRERLEQLGYIDE